MNDEIRYWVHEDSEGKPDYLGRTVQDPTGLSGELLTQAGWVRYDPVVENLFGHGIMNQVSVTDARRIAERLRLTFE